MATDILTEQIKDKLVHAAQTQTSVTEEELCKSLKVSRGPVRESLEFLEKQGLIERRKNKGTSLRKPSIKEFVELWDFRTGIEGFAARLACETLTPEELKELEDLVHGRKAQAEKGNEKAADDMDIAFHLRIVELSKNMFLVNTVQNLHLFERTFKVYYVVSSSEYDAQHDSLLTYTHEKILEALRARDSDEAERMMRFHIQEAKKRTIEALLGRVHLFEDKK